MLVFDGKTIGDGVTNMMKHGVAFDSIGVVISDIAGDVRVASRNFGANNSESVGISHRVETQDQCSDECCEK